jgi:hypothetical protein
MTQTSQDPHLPEVIMLAGLLAIASSILIVVAQAGFWLRYGAWPEVSLGWLFNCPLSGASFGSGLILAAVGIKLGR